MTESVLHIDTTLPHCPPHAHGLSAPSSFAMFLLVGLTSLVLGAVVALFYNSVGLPHLNQRIRTRAISNTLWIIFYLVVCIRAILGAVRYGLPQEHDTGSAAEYVAIAGVVVQGFSAMFLALALNYQLKHRTAQSAETEAFIGDEDGFRTSDGHLPVWKKLGRFMLSLDTVVVFLLIQYLVIVFVRLRVRNQASKSEDYLEWVQLASALLQRTPIVLLTAAIVFWANRSLVVGPKLLQRAMLLLATATNIPFDVPLSLWGDFNNAIRALAL